jgi:hypothetical protein
VSGLAHAYKSRRSSCAASNVRHVLPPNAGCSGTRGPHPLKPIPHHQQTTMAELADRSDGSAAALAVGARLQPMSCSASSSWMAQAFPPTQAVLYRAASIIWHPIPALWQYLPSAYSVKCCCKMMLHAPSSVYSVLPGWCVTRFLLLGLWAVGCDPEHDFIIRRRHMSTLPLNPLNRAAQVLLSSSKFNNQLVRLAGGA